MARRDARDTLAERTAVREADRSRQQRTDAAFARRLTNEVTPDGPDNHATETASARQVGAADIESPDDNGTADNDQAYHDSDHALGPQGVPVLTRGSGSDPDGEVNHDTENMAAAGGERARYHYIEPVPNVVIHHYHAGNWFSRDAQAIRTDVSERNGMAIVNRFY
ncbi:MAG: hypothetical protein M1815_004509 [Lichina confinis]|nr:MAG: hypothetical protein M1815_004509 [Lichina confinis]